MKQHHLKQKTMRWAVMALSVVVLSACSNNGSLNGLNSANNENSSANAPVKIFGAKEKSTQSNTQAMPVISAKMKINQPSIDKAIHRFRLKSKVSTGSHQTIGADLNGDGSPEGLVYFTGDDWCISTGCTLVVFANGTNGYRQMAVIKRVKAPILLAQEYTHGWRDLIVKTGNAGIGVRSVALKFGANYPPNASTIMEKLPEIPAATEILFADVPGENGVASAN